MDRIEYQNTVVTISNYATKALKETLERYGELGFELVNVVMAKNQYNVDAMYLFFTKIKKKQKIKLIVFLLLMMVIVVISLTCHISINTKYGGIFLLPVLYILVTYTVPKMIQDYIEEFKKSYNKYDYAITKNQFCDKCVYEATGKEVEELKHRVEAWNRRSDNGK